MDLLFYIPNSIFVLTNYNAKFHNQNQKKTILNGDDLSV